MEPKGGKDRAWDRRCMNVVSRSSSTVDLWTTGCPWRELIAFPPVRPDISGFPAGQYLLPSVLSVVLADYRSHFRQSLHEAEFDSRVHLPFGQPIVAFDYQIPMKGRAKDMVGDTSIDEESREPAVLLILTWGFMLPV